MCGIIGTIINKKFAKKQLLTIEKVFINQQSRGTDGFGISNNQPLSRTRGTTYSEVFGWSNAEYLNNIKKGVVFFHHRIPTSTENVIESAHPFFNEDKTLMLMHNGMISNDKDLHFRLKKKGHIFESETIIDEFNDSEVILHLLEEKLKETNDRMEDALELVGDELKGSFVIVVAREGEDKVWFLRFNNPLVISIDKDGNFFFSSEMHSKDENSYYYKKLDTGLKQIISLANGEIGYLTPSGYEKVKVVQFYVPPPVKSYTKFDYRGVINEQKTLYPTNPDPNKITGGLRNRINFYLKSYDWETNNVSFIDIADQIEELVKGEGYSFNGYDMYTNYIDYLVKYFTYRANNEYLDGEVIPNAKWLKGELECARYDY